MDSSLIVPLDGPSDQTTLPLVGGKGKNLAILSRNGLNVPSGLLITTHAYTQFVNTHGLGDFIADILSKCDFSASSLDSTSDLIRKAFMNKSIDHAFQLYLAKEYEKMGDDVPCAVRSSATAEDLPDMSFAGQQDTILNVVGSNSLMKAVVECWSSLWTPRAIGYRHRNKVSQDDLSLAVVVQQMVQSTSSGVLFTANPVTGNRHVTVIDATLGLGEALVSGQVEPDHYEIDMNCDPPVILSKTIGAKAYMIESIDGGGTRIVQSSGKDQEIDNSSVQALPDPQIISLAQLGQKVAMLDEYGGEPQDIEWACSNDCELGEELFLLQARPITSLFPIPNSVRDTHPATVMFSFGAVQGVSEPFTPVGISMVKNLAAHFATLFGFEHFTAETQKAVVDCECRVFVDMSKVARSSLARSIFKDVSILIEPSIKQALESLSSDESVCPPSPTVCCSGVRQRWGIFQALSPVVRPAAWGAIKTMLSGDPDAVREEVCSLMDSRLELFQKERERIDELSSIPYVMKKGCEELNEQVEGWRAAFPERMKLIRNAPSVLLPLFSVLLGKVVGPGQMALNRLGKMAAECFPDLDMCASTSDVQSNVEKNATQYHTIFHRGLPNNPTTEMDLMLWDVSRSVYDDKDSLQCFTDHSPQELSEMFESETMPTIAFEAVSQFLDKYGMRGYCEIDFGRERWNDAPYRIMSAIKGYLLIDPQDESKAPNKVFARSRMEIEELAEKLMSEVGWLKRKRVKKLFKIGKACAGMREQPKFWMIQALYIARCSLKQGARKLVEMGVLERVSDIFCFDLSELDQLGDQVVAGGPTEVEIEELRVKIRNRLDDMDVASRRKQIPRVLVSDGRAFYEGFQKSNTSSENDSETLIHGAPVSPGVVTARARVVYDPAVEGVQLQPGEIMICNGTDPSWTVLFLSAGGLITEVGGMMTHGSVVAREYGIPACVGVGNATQRIKTGQLLRVDGSAGLIEILSDDSDSNVESTHDNVTSV